jgi:hypothetical protein
MTHPASRLRLPRAASRDELLEPVRILFQAGEHRRSWWQKLPLVARTS